jgi:hypothetical protein
MEDGVTVAGTVGLTEINMEDGVSRRKIIL